MDASQQATLESLMAHQRWVSRLAHALVRDPASADDVVQETWRQVLERPPRGVRNPRAWLATLVRHAVVGRARTDTRRRERERTVAQQDVDDDHSRRLRAELHRDLVNAILTLEPGLQDVLLARYFDGLGPSEIARAQGDPLATVKARLRRGLEQLRLRLDAEYGDRRQWSLALLPLARVPRRAVVASGGMLLCGAVCLLACAVMVLNWRATSPRVRGSSPDYRGG